MRGMMLSYPALSIILRALCGPLPKPRILRQSAICTLTHRGCSLSEPIRVSAGHSCSDTEPPSPVSTQLTIQCCNDRLINFTYQNERGFPVWSCHRPRFRRVRPYSFLPLPLSRRIGDRTGRWALCVLRRRMCIETWHQRWYPPTA